MKNNISDLNNYLFECIERVMDDTLEDEELDKEIKKAKAVTNIAKTIIDSGRLALHAAQTKHEMGYESEVPKSLTGGNSDAEKD